MGRSIGVGLAIASAALLAAGCSASANGDPGGVSGGTSTGATGGHHTGTGGSGHTGGATNGGTGGGINLGGAGGSAGSGAGSGGASGAVGTGGNTCGPPPTDQPVPEVCGNGLDDDLNGFVDEGCPCSVGASQPCFGGLPSQATAPNCTMGTQQCTGTPEFHGWGKCSGWQCGTVPPDEICNNGIDDNCNGLVDEGCGITMPVNLNGDCLEAACPPQAPYPIGCNIVMAGGDSRGCVSVAPGGGVVYFQEGDACPIIPGIGDTGNVSGTLLCSSVPGPPLDNVNCPITTKSTQYYPTSGGPPRWGCP